jgi:hypothetical protein
MLGKITLHDLRVAEQQIPHLKRKSAYTAKKNAVSFELSLHSGKDRGEILEHIVSRKLKGLGIENNTFDYNAPYDIEFSITNKKRPLRIEVKSSLMRQDITYNYQAIKPNNFDYIFFVQVDPEKGLLIRWTTRRRIMNGIKRSGSKRYPNGYGLCMRITETNKYGIELFDLEDFPYESVESLIKRTKKTMKKYEKMFPNACNS